MNLKQYLPTRQQLKEMRSMRFLGDMILEPNLWRFNSHSLSFAVLVGCICCFLPIPLQSIPCAFLCVWIRCNVPVAMVIVWSSNPITIGPLLYFAYRVGAWILDLERQAMPANPGLEWFTDQLSALWQPLLLGCFVCGVTSGITGFLMVRLYYWWRIARYKQRRQKRRQPGEITRI